MEIPERELVKILKKFGEKKPAIIRGIGDDGAVVRIEDSSVVLCQDAIVEGIHFTFSYLSPYQVGKKALYVNIADVLSMGAEPLFYQVTLGIPKRIGSDSVRAIYRGMRRVGCEFGITLVGGDVVSTKTDFFIDVSMVGLLKLDTYKGRNLARERDLIGVTGYLGESAYGLLLLRSGLEGKKGQKRFVDRYRNPRPPYEIWKELIKHDITNAMMDISDGLLIDLERMMEESKKCGIIYFDKLPIPRDLKKEKLEDLALSGGEDYQFLFTFSKTKIGLLESLIKKGYKISVIGEVVSGKGVKLIKDGKAVEYKIKGYDHFTNG
ncbi:MAG: thiamine-phosphate kinase [Desulfobacterota bacterium]|nr:thiamine-phosphate kinase [Thermodesulfobacteriota bacterium]MDW8002404.1 thiamine-phosphate kinase [Deltaproteobacteria bacterium]